MHNKFTSERLIEELPKNLINFLWYLWEIYSQQGENQSRFAIKALEEKGSLRITVASKGKSIVQDFGISLNAEIIIRKKEGGYYMTYED